MQTPQEFYSSQIEEKSANLAQIKKRLLLLSLLRLGVFCVVGFAMYLTFANTPLFVGILVGGLILFIFLVVKHTGVTYKKEWCKKLLALNKDELKVLNGQRDHLFSGEEYKDDTHAYCNDIDLFGEGSFFQYINRTALETGRNTLAFLLKENVINKIQIKQEAIKELAAIPKWRQDFSATASLVKTEVSAKKVIKWLQDYQPFVPKIMQWMPIVFSILSVIFFTAYFLDFISGYVVFGWFLVGLAISGAYLKKVNTLSAHTAQIQSTFQQYYKLLSKIEAQEFSSQLLSEKKVSIIDKTKNASSILKQFSKRLDALDQRNNMLIGVLANGFMLRDLKQSLLIEQWIATYKDEVNTWFKAITFFDSYNSLGNFVFNHPKYVFPIINNNDVIIDSKQIGHPLLNPNKVVRSDFSIAKETFFIVTGANMAGKSTFLRTVGLQIVMANLGLPVSAEKVNYSPIKLISSMQTSDSLTDDESYFFSELKRLKYIVEAIKQDEYFIILDEILKGTNSTDKAQGSRKFIDKLVASKSTGIIATHDLSLCDAANEYEEVKNYYFDAEIVNNELYFDYTLKKGICQNMNASFLLKKMGIVN
ncbi:MutS-related protein [Patiriisocius hiemis]|uniref:DNA mismatch repair protein MutS n=1 Tax=Patiriisocius hiemis TaxID=3075604 RepID=A0ABU2YDT6_9FLAO|nr:DNA mismatch repair protein MutS [Constantimarinum sp. W242]MDT0556341.1 DNA mismatch repair protein MutS [Constantimarinum sp. W242]